MWTAGSVAAAAAAILLAAVILPRGGGGRVQMAESPQASTVSRSPRARAEEGGPACPAPTVVRDLNDGAKTRPSWEVEDALKQSTGFKSKGSEVAGPGTGAGAENGPEGRVGPKEEPRAPAEPVRQPHKTGEVATPVSEVKKPQRLLQPLPPLPQPKPGVTATIEPAPAAAPAKPGPSVPEVPPKTEAPGVDETTAKLARERLPLEKKLEEPGLAPRAVDVVKPDSASADAPADLGFRRDGTRRRKTGALAVYSVTVRSLAGAAGGVAGPV